MRGPFKIWLNWCQEMTDVRIAKPAIQVRPVPCMDGVRPSTNDCLSGWASWSVRLHLIFCSSLGAISPSPVTNVNPLAGNLSVHAMRLPPPQAGYPHIKGQILKHG